MLDKGLQFVAELTKEQNNMLGIQTKLLTAFHPQIDGQTECINQELEQYLWFFVDNKQKNWSEQLISAEFVINSKIYSATKVFPLKASYGRELKMGVDIKRKEKIEKVIEFAERIKKIQEKVEAALKRAQEEIKKKVYKGRWKIKTWKKEENVMLSIKDLVFKK